MNEDMIRVEVWATYRYDESVVGVSNIQTVLFQTFLTSIEIRNCKTFVVPETMQEKYVYLQPTKKL